MSKTITLCFLIALSFLGGCGKSGGSSRYKQGVEYTYYTDNSCTPSDNRVCLTPAEYKEICSSASGVTAGAVKKRSFSAYGTEKTLLENGSIDHVRVVWGKSNRGQEYCYGIVSVSGIVNGSSAKADVQGIAMTFIKNKDNELLISYFDLM